MFWLTSTGRGQKAAKGIAMEWRRWMRSGLREVDMRVSVCWRLMLELARLQDLEREAGREIKVEEKLRGAGFFDV